MKLLRVATIYFSPPPAGWEAWTITLGRCVVSTMSVKGSPAPEGQMRTFVTAQVPLSEPPAVDAEGLITPPEDLRKECEAAIEAAAAIIAVMSDSARHISSPFPPMALVAESDSERAFLAAARGFRSRSRALSRARYSVPLSPTVIEALRDRLDGVVLLADLRTQTHAIARYREAVRFLELAFALPASQLERKLAQFLAPTDAGYTRAEVARWLSLRHAAVHADRPGSTGLVVEGDVRPFMARLEQALADVLLNKAAWHDPSRSRRDLFNPPAVTTGPDGGMRIIERSTFTLEAQLLDPFQAYPMDLSAVLNSPPAEWWCPWGSERAIEHGVGAEEPQM